MKVCHELILLTFYSAVTFPTPCKAEQTRMTIYIVRGDGHSKAAPVTHLMQRLEMVGDAAWQGCDAHTSRPKSHHVSLSDHRTSLQTNTPSRRNTYFSEK